MTHTWEIVSFLGRSRWSSARQIQQVHAVVFPRGLQNDNHILSLLIAACHSVGHPEYGNTILRHAHCPNTYLFNSMISLLSPSPQAILFYRAIFHAGLRPDSYSIPFALKSLHAGPQLHSHAILTGLSSHASVATALLRMYSLCRGLLDARQVFDELPLGDHNVWNAMIAAYARADRMDSALQLFHRMPRRNLISWTCVLSRLARMKRPAQALAVFNRMLTENVYPDEVALLALLSACAQLTSLELGKRIHSYILKRGFCGVLPLNNALVDMYAKSGSISMAIAVFERIKEKSVVSWTTIIAGLALHGLVNQVTEIFCRMGNAGMKPNEVTFIAVLSACSHSGLVEMGRWYFNNMASRFGVQPKIQHYGCIIDILGRAGYLEEAMDIVRGMPFEPNAAIWGSLLAASNIHGDAELGEIALRKLTVLEALNSGNYMLLSNIYAKENRGGMVSEGHK